MGTGAVGAEVDGTGVGAPGDAGVDGVRVGAGVDGEGEGDGDGDGDGEGVDGTGGGGGGGGGVTQLGGTPV